jgi:AcrR family transcriptional regulator
MQTLAGVGDDLTPTAQHIVETAYDLFAQRGVRDVGVDEVIERSGVAKATLYRHFPSKDALVLTFLQVRERLWTFDLIAAESHRRGSTPQERLLAIFDVFHEWFHRDDFEGCAFVNVMLEMRPQHPLGRASIDHLATIRDMVHERAEQAGLEDAETFAHSMHMIMKGAVVAATEGDTNAAVRARSLAELLIDQHR